MIRQNSTCKHRGKRPLRPNFTFIKDGKKFHWEANNSRKEAPIEISHLSLDELTKYAETHPNLPLNMLTLLSTEETSNEIPNPSPKTPLQERLHTLLQRYEEVTAPLTEIPPIQQGVVHHILIRDDKASWDPIYALSAAELTTLKDEFDRLFQLGFINPSISPYGAPVSSFKNQISYGWFLIIASLMRKP